MRKSTLFISAALTTFMLAVLFGVASAYKNIVSSTQEVAAQPQPTAMVEMVSAPIPTQVVNLTPEEAAAIASKVIGRTDLYSVEGAQLDGVDAYLVTFSSGDLVYVGMDGQVLSISKVVVTVVTQGHHGGGGGGEEDGGSGGGGGGGGGDDGHESGGDDGHDGGGDD
jgi:uncharacterized membrane protein YgcG